MHRLTIRLALAIVAAGSLPAAAQEAARYIGKLSGGQPLSGAKLSDWHSPDASPRLDNQPLLDPQNPFRWLRDRALRLPQTPEAFVETFTGDRLPGAVVEYAEGLTDSFDAQPPHFVVEATCELRPPRPWFAASQRVVADAVRRIVWRKRSLDKYEPATVFYRDGRTVSFRSVRFDGASAFLLLDDGQAEARFDEIAELHFPARDPWEAYFAELAALSPDGQSRLLQVETTDGLIATASRDRFLPTEGGAGDADRWIHGLQPAWRLDPLWVPSRNIAVRRSFAPHEVPLTRLLPQSELLPSPLRGASTGPAINRNVEGGLLESGDAEYGWGFGILGASELRLPLPEIAATLQGRVGLDRIVRSGGSIQARVFLDNTDGSPLWQSAPLVGTSQVTDLGSLKIAGEAGKKRELILQIDPLLKNAPAGADPLDIRDMADWLEPLLLLDPEKLQLEMPPRTPQTIAAWRGWSAEVDSPEALKWISQFDLNAQFDAFRLAAAPHEQPLRLARQFRPHSGAEWLVVLTEQAPGSKERAKLEVRVEGELAAQWEVPPYTADPTQRQALAVSLAPFRSAGGRPVRLEIVQSPTNAESPVIWRTAAITHESPLLRPLLEDEGEFATAEGAEETSIAWDTSNRHSGQRAVQIQSPGRYTLRLPRPAAIRERPALGEFRFIRFAFRKAGKGRAAIELHRNEQDAPPIRYDAGLGEPSYGAAARVWSLELPNEWIVQTRDLFKDFGRADVTALTLSVPDGEHAWFDHVYLARSEKDLDAIPAAPSPESVNQEARRELAKNVLDKAMPATVAVDYGDGRFSTGVLVSKEGDVLTAGHAVVAPDKEVTVALRDGRRLKGKTRGVARDLDLGLVRIEEKGDWPTVEVRDARELPPDQLYLGVAHRRVVESEEAPDAHIVGIQRVLEGVVWTDFEVDDWSAGGPLLDKDARLVGIQRGESQFGGFVYTQFLGINDALARMRKGDVWGAWPPGCGPMMGVHVESVSGGCRITEVYLETPAVTAGLKEGDRVVKIDGRPVRHLDDIYAKLAEMNPGQSVKLELRRGSDTLDADLDLIPRTP